MSDACLTSPTTQTSGSSGKASASEIWISYSAASEMSHRTSRAGRKRAICLQSSAPIEPPAPVTSTTRLPSHSPSPALSRTTGSRPSRSSSSTLRIVVRSERPLMSSSYEGTVSASSPAAAQTSAARRRTPCSADGSAMITLRTP